MKFKFLPHLTLLLVFVLTISCDRPECKNSNPIFDQFTPDRNEYKRELAKQMKTIGEENLQYWFDKSQNVNNTEFYELYIQGDGLCAKIVVENKSNRTRLGNGGYRGAELKGIAIKTNQDSTETSFVLEKIERILD